VIFVAKISREAFFAITILSTVQNVDKKQNRRATLLEINI
jgi:hypothetical protein